MSLDKACLFCQIINKTIPANIVLEDEEVIAFHDINPTAPVHILIVPKIHVKNISEISIKEQNFLMAMMLMAKNLSKKFEANNDGFRLVINNGASANQSIFHLHMHLLAGRTFSWPAG